MSENLEVRTFSKFMKKINQEMHSIREKDYSKREILEK